VALVVASAAPSSPPRVQTVAQVTGVPYAFDFDSGRVAWIDDRFILHVLPLAGGAERRTAIYRTSGERDDLALGYVGQLCLEGRRAVWVSTVHAGGGFDVADRVQAASLDTLRPQLLLRTRHLDGGSGESVTGLVSDDAGFSFSAVRTVQLTPDADAYRVTAGRTWEYASGRLRRIPGVPPAFLLSRGGGVLALAPVETGETDTPGPLPLPEVDLVGVSNGGVTTISTAWASTPTPILRPFVTNGRVALLEVGRRLDRYSVATGGLLGTLTLPPGTFQALDLSGSRAALSTPTTVYVVDVVTSKVTTAIRTAPWHVSRVSIDRSRVAWIESRWDARRRKALYRIRSAAIR
jgi:hypothetical protein